MLKHVLIIADIEGSSGCFSYESSSFMTSSWPHACLEMTKDVDKAVKAAFAAGVPRVTVKDFHRTGYNLLPEHIDSRANVVSGYRWKPVPGIGNPGSAEGVLFLGMHAASGSTGFLAHTLSSRIQALLLNGQPLPEVSLFAASLAPFNIRPILFSGCPAACRQATLYIPGIHTCPIDKTPGPNRFDAVRWRKELDSAITAALAGSYPDPHRPKGPFEVIASMRDGEAAARKLAHRWQLDRQGADLYLRAESLDQIYLQLIRLCYLTPWSAKILPLSLALHNLKGRWGLAWVRRKLKLEEG